MPEKSLPWMPFCTSVVVATVLGSITQTQFNLAALQGLGASIDTDVRLQATLHDLVGFSPTLAALVLVAFLVAIPLTSWIAPYLGIWRWPAFLLAGAAAVWLALATANSLAPMPTLIAADRSLAGTLALMACGGCGALAFTWLRGVAR